MNTQIYETLETRSVHRFCECFSNALFNFVYKQMPGVKTAESWFATLSLNQIEAWSYNSQSMVTTHRFYFYHCQGGCVIMCVWLPVFVITQKLVTCLYNIFMWVGPDQRKK